MTYLLDVSTLLALLWRNHVHHERVAQWQDNQTLAVCPLTELGFLRISTQAVFGATVAEARNMLHDWRQHRQQKCIPCDVETLKTDAPSSGTKTTDFYLASLAAKHGMLLATLDTGIRHRAAFLVPELEQPSAGQPAA
jgi:toxin-antitoxin system PIN domain toxin